MGKHVSYSRTTGFSSSGSKTSTSMHSLQGENRSTDRQHGHGAGRRPGRGCTRRLTSGTRRWTSSLPSTEATAALERRSFSLAPSPAGALQLQPEATASGTLPIQRGCSCPAAAKGLPGAARPSGQRRQPARVLVPGGGQGPTRCCSAIGVAAARGEALPAATPHHDGADVGA